MKLNIGKRLTLAAAIGAMTLGTASCGGAPGAGDFPTRDIDVVVPYPAGGGTDTLARALVDAVNKKGDLGKRLRVINKDGGAGAVGTTEVMTARPDGYTIGVIPDGPLTLVPHNEEVTYDPSEFTAIREINVSPLMLVVPQDSPYKSASDLIDAAGAAPSEITLAEGPLNYAYPAELLEQETDTQFKRVKFEGDQATLTALLGNNVDAAIIQLSGANAQLKAGKVRSLGLFSEEETELAKGVPTLASQGIDLTWEAFNLVVAPPGLPEAVTEKLESAFADAISDPEFITTAERLGFVASDVDGNETKAHVDEKFEFAAGVMDSSE